jgi:hypothetical protein
LCKSRTSLDHNTDKFMLLIASMVCGMDFYPGMAFLVDSPGKILLFVRVMS